MLSDPRVMNGVHDMIKRLEISIMGRAGGDAANVVMQDPTKPALCMILGLSQGRSSVAFGNGNDGGSGRALGKMP